MIIFIKKGIKYFKANFFTFFYKKPDSCNNLAIFSSSRSLNKKKKKFFFLILYVTFIYNKRKYVYSKNFERISIH